MLNKAELITIRPRSFGQMAEYGNGRTFGVVGNSKRR
jgi:hypothetical protein